jgi:hypothetical protein
MSRRFGQVPLSLWRNAAFKGLSDDGKLALLFVWCGPHSTSAGIGVLPDAYASSDLNWQVDRWIRARQELAACELVAWDEAKETVFVEGFLASNGPVNVRHRAAIVNQISSIECGALREKAEAALSAVEASKTKPVRNVQSDASPQLQAIMNSQRMRA